MSVWSDALNKREHIIRVLRDIANAIESKPDSCIVSRISETEDNMSIRIITDFERNDKGIQYLATTELTLAYVSRIPLLDS